MADNKEHMNIKTLSQIRDETTQTPTTPSAPDASKKALRLCLKRIKNAKDEIEIHRLTEYLQRIVFHKQYENAKD